MKYGEHSILHLDHGINGHSLSAKRVLKAEIEGLSSLINVIERDFNDICELLLNCTGKIVVMGIGKSGHVGKKIASTFASTGTPAIFVHPSEALHGDLGMIESGDVVIAISNSGQSEELLRLIPHLKDRETKVVSITKSSDSMLAKSSMYSLILGQLKEACPHGLAPTTTTTATLVLGDALAVALLEARGFTRLDFAKSHPGGSLGKMLTVRVQHAMHSGTALPACQEESYIIDALMEITKKGLGFTAVVDEDNKLRGIFTDGDLRRSIETGADIRIDKVKDWMTEDCLTVQENVLAVDAVKIMKERNISSLIVINDHQDITGALNLNDLLIVGLLESH